MINPSPFPVVPCRHVTVTKGCRRSGLGSGRFSDVVLASHLKAVDPESPSMSREARAVVVSRAIALLSVVLGLVGCPTKNLCQDVCDKAVQCGFDGGPDLGNRPVIPGYGGFDCNDCGGYSNACAQCLTAHTCSELASDPCRQTCGIH